MVSTWRRRLGHRLVSSAGDSRGFDGGKLVNGRKR